MNRKIILLASTILLTSASCGIKSAMDEDALLSQNGSGTIQNASKEAEAISTSFDKEKAAAAVLKDHPEFPKPGETKEIETITGGPAPGTKVKGTLSTTVEASSEPDTYIVTLTKNWNFSVNEKKLLGDWKYKVTPQSVQLIESEDNTDLIRIVK